MSKSNYPCDNPVEPVPPLRMSMDAGHHWLEIRDIDGHSFGLIVLQWQPYAKKWCRSGDIATGRDMDCSGWIYVAPCPIPVI